ncbi:MAG: hypothetical protein ABJB34_01055 [Acidobacteriota bacterium]
MREKKQSKLKRLSDELAVTSNSLADVPHFFWFVDPETKETAYFASLVEGDACQIIEILAQRYGGEVLDRVIDIMIAHDEYFEFPDFIGCATAFINDGEDMPIDDTERN